MDKILIGKEIDGESWYTHDFVEMLSKQNTDLKQELESWIKLIDYKGIEDIPQYVSDLEVDNKQLKEENQLLNKNYNIINELEKYIEIKMNSFGVCNASDIYYKLQELKGSGNND